MNGCAARPVRWCTSRETCAYNMAHHHVGCCARALCACGCKEESAQCRKWFGFGKVRYMHVFFLFFLAIACVCMWRRTLVVGGGETDLATRGARLRTQGVSCAHVFVSVCVCAYAPAPLCRVPVCTTRLAFAGSNSAGRARAAWLACVCVPLFLVLC